MRTILQARSIGQIALEALNSLRVGPVGEIVASFPSSFYIRTSGGQLLFFTNRQLKSPVTVNLDSGLDFECRLKPLGEVFFEQAELHVGDDLAVDLSNASTHASQSDLAALQIGQIREALYLVATILAIVDNDLSVLDHKGKIYSRAGRFARSGILPLRDSGNGKAFVETAEGIVGLGGGLTPSGDDLLAGFLATYNSLAQVVGRDKIVIDFRILEKKTSWISAKLLDYMQRGIYDDEVAQLIQSVGLGNEGKFVEALQTLLPRGHTSGLDMAVGSVLADALLLDLAYNVHETETIIRRLGFLETN